MVSANAERRCQLLSAWALTTTFKYKAQQLIDQANPNMDTETGRKKPGGSHALGFAFALALPPLG